MASPPLTDLDEPSRQDVTRTLRLLVRSLRPAYSSERAMIRALGLPRQTVRDLLSGATEKLADRTLDRIERGLHELQTRTIMEDPTAAGRGANRQVFLGLGTEDKIRGIVVPTNATRFSITYITTGTPSGFGTTPWAPDVRTSVSEWARRNNVPAETITHVQFAFKRAK